MREGWPERAKEGGGGRRGGAQAFPCDRPLTLASMLTPMSSAAAPVDPLKGRSMMELGLLTAQVVCLPVASAFVMTSATPFLSGDVEEAALMAMPALGNRRGLLGLFVLIASA